MMVSIVQVTEGLSRLFPSRLRLMPATKLMLALSLSLATAQPDAATEKVIWCEESFMISATKLGNGGKGVCN